jgi:hypothetical protein
MSPLKLRRNLLISNVIHQCPRKLRGGVGTPDVKTVGPAVFNKRCFGTLGAHREERFRRCLARAAVVLPSPAARARRRPRTQPLVLGTDHARPGRGAGLCPCGRPPISRGALGDARLLGPHAPGERPIVCGCSRPADDVFRPRIVPLYNRMNFRLNFVDLTSRAVGLSEIGNATTHFRKRLSSGMAVD